MTKKRWVAIVAAVALLAGLVVVPITMATTATTVTSLMNRCTAVSLDANGVGQGGAGYVVVTYNIRGAQLSAKSAGMSKHAGDYKWSKRGPVVASYLQALNPDIVGLQENGVIPGTDRRQLSTLKASLPGYTWLGAGRPTPLGVRTSAFTVLDHEWVRLSTAGVGGATGDRFALVATLRATSDGTKFLAINLHSQHMQLKGAARARSTGWTKLLNALERINPGNRLPTVMVGDFNANSTETRAVFNAHLVKFGAAGFVDAAATATRIAPIENVTSFNGFGDTIGGKWYYKSINRNSTGNHIDYVWTNGAAKATTWQIYTGPSVSWKTIKGQQVPFADFIPSDHWPIVSKVQIGTAAAAADADGDSQMSLDSGTTAATQGGFGLPRAGQPRQQSLRSPALPIPAGIKSLYVAAAARYGLPWQLLAGIGMAETRHGANNNTSSAGAQGLMQFMPATFASFGVDGDGDGHADIRNDADSIYSAANYLVHSGAKKGSQGVIDALWAYNHSVTYRNDVLFYAWSYAGAAGITVGGDPDSCNGAGTAPGGDATGEWADVLSFALSLVGKYPYSWGGGTLTGPSRGFGQGANIVGFDCSSFNRYVVYQKAGVTLPRTSRDQAKFFQQRGLLTQTKDWRSVQAGDIVFYSRGKSIASIYHVAIVTKNGWIVEEPGAGRYVQHNPMQRRMPNDFFGYARVDLAALKANRN